MTDTLTQKQADILRFIKRFMAISGFPPSIREIGDEFNIGSPNGVMTHVRALRRKGFLREPEPAQSRNCVPAVGLGCCPCCGQAVPGGLS